LKKENLVYLVCGFAFGIVAGFGLFNAMHHGPTSEGAAASGAAMGAPQGPMAPTQTGGAAGGDASAPMMAEIRALKQRVDSNPQDHQALVRLANIYHDVSMFDQAIGYYEQAVQLEPGNPDTLTDLGICYRGTQQYDKALEMFNRAQAIDPNHWQSLFNIVIVAGFDLGRFEAADEALTKMERMNPKPPRVDELRSALQEAQAKAGSSGEG